MAHVLIIESRSREEPICWPLEFCLRTLPLALFFTL